MKVIFRGFLGREKRFEEEVEISPMELDEVLPSLAEKHVDMLASSKLHMIEIEFPEEPDINQRFMRFGTDPSGMVIPIEVRLDASVEYCHCGLPLHYTDKAVAARVHDLVAKHGEFIRVTALGRTWVVPRHYIALHGIPERDLPNLGFAEARHVDLTADKYPFTIEALHVSTREVVWSLKVEAPGLVTIPPLRRQFGHPVSIRITWPDGTSEEGSPEANWAIQ